MLGVVSDKGKELERDERLVPPAAALDLPPPSSDPGISLECLDNALRRMVGFWGCPCVGLDDPLGHFHLHDSMQIIGPIPLERTSHAESKG